MGFNLDAFIRDLETGRTAGQVCEYLIVNGLVDYTAARNIAVRKYFYSLKCSDRTQAKLETANAFCLSPEYVHQILYSRKLGKKKHYSNI